MEYCNAVITWTRESNYRNYCSLQLLRPPSPALLWEHHMHQLMCLWYVFSNHFVQCTFIYTIQGVFALILPCKKWRDGSMIMRWVNFQNVFIYKKNDYRIHHVCFKYCHFDSRPSPSFLTMSFYMYQGKMFFINILLHPSCKATYLWSNPYYLRVRCIQVLTSCPTISHHICKHLSHECPLSVLQ